MELKELENEVLKLSIEDRGALAEKLILSVDAPSETENLRLWVAEAERRLKELREGTIEEIPVEEVFRTCQSRYLMRRVAFHPEADNEVIEAACRCSILKSTRNLHKILYKSK